MYAKKSVPVADGYPRAKQNTDAPVPSVHIPRKQAICTGSRAKVGPAHAKLGQCALVITQNCVMGRYLANILSLRVDSVHYTTSGIDALKEITERLTTSMGLPVRRNIMMRKLL